MRVSENLYKTLINSELWFATPQSFNDPFDCQLNDSTDWSIRENEERFFKFLYNRYSKKGKKSFESFSLSVKKTGVTNEMMSGIVMKEASLIGVTCFSTKFDNILMWSHYSDSHKGICLKFDRNLDKVFFQNTHFVKY